MAKNIVLCCDGTANEFARDRTNVVKLYSGAWCTSRRCRPPTTIPGVGTMEAVGALTTFARKGTKLLGHGRSVTASKTDIRDAYVFLMNHFEEGDRLFLFGFSRGAYTVRCRGLAAPHVRPDSARQRAAGAVRHPHDEGDNALRGRKARKEVDAYFEPRARLQAARCRRRSVQAVFRRRVGHGEFGRLDREAPASCPTPRTIPTSRSAATRSPSTSGAPFSGTNLWRPSHDPPVSTGRGT